jgi:1-deoxy-D-xylulose-5-phosphate synthase
MIAYGSMVYPAVQAAENLAKDGIEATVVNARFVKPLDEKLILEIAGNEPFDHHGRRSLSRGRIRFGGDGTFERKGIAGQGESHVRMGVPDRIVTHGDAKLLLAKYGLDADGIYQKVKESVTALGAKPAGRKQLRAVK